MSARKFLRENGNFVIIASAVLVGLLVCSWAIQQAILPRKSIGGAEEARTLRWLERDYQLAPAGSAEKEKLVKRLADQATEFYRQQRLDFNCLLDCVNYRLVPWSVLWQHNRPLALQVQSEFRRRYGNFPLWLFDQKTPKDRANFWRILDRLTRDGVISWAEIGLSPDFVRFQAGLT